MIIRRPTDIPSSEITPEDVYVNRRQFLSAMGIGAAGLIAGEGLSQEDKQNTYEEITSYNNFYEFGSDKSDPAEQAPRYLKPRPWTVSVEGLCKKPGKYALDDFLKPYKLEDRVYRMRCVEGWSMVIPWRGFPLKDLIARAEPNPSAKYVEFFTLLDPKQMPAQKTDLLDWPYNEGLRLDEAMHPLTILSIGLRGNALPAQT